MFSPGDSLVSAPPSLCASLQSEDPIKVRKEQPKFNFNCSCSNPIFPDLSSLAATHHSFHNLFNALDFWVILHFGFLLVYLFLVSFPFWLDIYPLLDQQSLNIQSSWLSNLFLTLLFLVLSFTYLYAWDIYNQIYRPWREFYLPLPFLLLQNLPPASIKVLLNLLISY